jgi:hypothetical protein
LERRWVTGPRKAWKDIVLEITRKTALQDPDGPTAGDVGISVMVETRREIEDPGGRDHLPR